VEQVVKEARINGKTQVARWYECRDGLYCLELIIGGHKYPIQYMRYKSDQVTDLRPELEIRDLEEAKKVWERAC
jgi:hypothetical protein